jgi:hypothetical protein
VLERISGKSDELANRRSIVNTVRKLLLNKKRGADDIRHSSDL